MTLRESILSFPHQLRRSLGTHGLRRATAITWHRFHERFCDWRLGIETSKPIAIAADESCHDYEATDYRLLKRMFRLFRHRASGVVFLDYGCGKGRAVILAGLHRFKRVIGIETHDGLLNVARSNLARLRKRQRCENVELVLSNAGDFEVPDDVNTIFLFNPFSGGVLNAVITRIEESLFRSPRELTVLYLRPVGFTPDVFSELDWCQHVVDISVSRHRSLRFSVYESTSLGR